MLKIPFSPPYIDDEAIKEVTEVLKSGWITTGPKNKEFEELLTEFVGVDNILCINAATSGLELALRWYGVSEGDEVILPAYTYGATANVIEHVGAKAVFVDSGNDFNISVDAIKKAITPNTKVIMPVDIGGLPANYDEIMSLVGDSAIKSMFNPNSYNQQKLGRIMVLSDAAHSLGAMYNGKMVGSIADLTVFSFHAVKNLTTAEGGAMVFNLPKPFDNGELYRFMKVFSLHGQSKDAFSKTKAKGWEYDILMPGYKANMPDVLAAVGLSQMRKYSKILARRKAIFDFYKSELSKYDYFQLPVYEDEKRTSSYHVFLLRISESDAAKRDAIIQGMYDNGVAVNIHFKPIPMMSYYKNKGYNINDYPVAYENYIKEISLPVYYDLSESDMQLVVDTLKSVCEL
ncbi:MAG: DegT/DnrJ/EryC1/StrS aminotransferase family protein [Salinivirgaceae bacterium]